MSVLLLYGFNNSLVISVYSFHLSGPFILVAIAHPWNRCPDEYNTLALHCQDTLLCIVLDGRQRSESRSHWLAFPLFIVSSLTPTPWPPSLPPLSLSPPQELDFTREASNAAKCAANFETSPHKELRTLVAVPRTFPAVSSHRVLTMEWMDGVPVTSVHELEAMGIRSADVARLVSWLN